MKPSAEWIEKWNTVSVHVPYSDRVVGWPDTADEDSVFAWDATLRAIYSDVYAQARWETLKEVHRTWVSVDLTEEFLSWLLEQLEERK